MEILYMVKCTSGDIDIKVNKNGQNGYCTLKSKESITLNGQKYNKNEYEFKPLLTHFTGEEKRDICRKAIGKFDSVEKIY